mgnify:FL=1
MNRIFNAFKKVPKAVYGIFAVVAMAIIVPTVLNAYGPNRTLFTRENAAPYVTFNSITNSDPYGYEPRFVQVKDVTEGTAFNADSVKIKSGHTYEVFLYYHNNAKSSLHLTAENAYARINMPAEIHKGEKANVIGYVGASNANPKEVWDEVEIVGEDDLTIRALGDSGKIVGAPNNPINGKALDVNKLLSKEGHPLGYNALDGKVPGCAEYSGHLLMRFTAVRADFDIKKKVSETGKNNWQKSIKAKNGDIVDFALSYKNTGSVNQNNVSFHDILPKGLSLVPGTVEWYSAHTNAQWKKPNDENHLLSVPGMNLGNYAPKGNAYVKFKAKVNLDSCGTHALKNVLKIYTENGTREDNATVYIENPACTQSCDTLKITAINATTFNFNTIYKAEGATLNYVTYIVRNSNGKEVAKIKSENGKTEVNNFVMTNSGTYTVEAIVTVTRDGKTIDLTGDCKGSFTISTPTDNCKIPGKEHLPADSEECRPNGIVLPKTGIGGLMSLIAVGVATAVVAYIATNKKVFKTLRKK